MSALDKQEGGGHYKNLVIQPVEYITKNNLGFIEGNIVKYISRHGSKNGAEDIKKVIHYCELLLELEYGTEQDPGECGHTWVYYPGNSSRQCSDCKLIEKFEDNKALVDHKRKSTI